MNRLVQRILSKSFQDSRGNSRTGLSTFKEKRSQVHAVKVAENTESKLHKQQLMTCLNSQRVGFNMEENCTNQLLCFCGVGVECQCAEEGPDLLLDACLGACPHARLQ